MGFRFTLYNERPTSPSATIWQNVETGSITHYTNTPTVNSRVITTPDGDITIKYTSNSLLNVDGVDQSTPIVDCHDTTIGTNYPTNVGVPKYTKGLLQLIIGGWRHEVALARYKAWAYVGKPTYNNTLIVDRSAAETADSNNPPYTGVAYVYAYDVTINNEAFIYFSSKKISDGVGLTGFGISWNAFAGSETPRYTEPTTPDPDGGYGTGETPSGNQNGTPTSGTSSGSGGGDHITVYPPNVSVDVVVNMPEPDKPERGQPFGSGINMAIIDDNAFTVLTDALWGRNQTAFDDLWVPFKNYFYNPIEAVVSCFRLPQCFMSQLSGSDGSISIAGTLIVGFDGTRIISPSMVTADWVVTGITQFNSWEDFEGVTVRAYAPYIGWFELDPSLCFGVSSDETRCSITFSYTCDCSNGNLFLEIWANSVGKGDTQTHEAPIAFGSGNCAYPVMLSSNDLAAGAAAKGLAGMGVGAITAATGIALNNPMLMTGGFLGTVSSGLNAVGNSSQHTTTVGSMTGSVGCLGYLVPFVEVIKPRYVMPEHHNKVYGRPSYAGSKVSDFAGHYAEIDVHCDDIDFANDWEQQKIIEMLAGGVHV